MNFIEVKNIYFEYKKGNPVINNVNLKIKKSEVTAFTGPNGSGKTTLGKLMMGILKPIRGQVCILGKNTLEMSLAEIGSTIGYLFQNPEKHFFTNTVEEELGFIHRFKGMNEDYLDNRIKELLELFQLEDLKKTCPLLVSRGEQQRLAIATVLINDPEYLILDEPTVGLDFKRREILIEVLKKLIEKGNGMTIISHDHYFVEEFSSRVIKIHRGEIVYDKRN